MTPDKTIKRMVLMRRIWNLDQKSMAKAIGVSHRTWQRIEYADTRITLDILFKIAQIFQVSPAFFVEPCLIDTASPSAASKTNLRSLTGEAWEEHWPRNVIPLLRSHAPALASDFREVSSRGWPLCEITLDSLHLNPSAQKLLNLPASQYSLRDLFDNKSGFVLLLERLLLDAPGKCYAFCALNARFPGLGSRRFVLMLRLLKRSWDNPRFLAVVVDTGHLERDFFEVVGRYEHRELLGKGEVAVLLYPAVT